MLTLSSAISPDDDPGGPLRKLFVGFGRWAGFLLAGNPARARRREEALRRVEHHYRSFIDDAPIGIFRTTPNGRFLSANRKLAAIFGYPSPEDVVRSITDIARQLYVDPADRHAIMSRAMEVPLVKNAEIRFRRRDGDIGWLSINLRAILDDQGGVHYYDGFATDITDRKEAQEALIASERMLRHFVRWVRDVIYRLDDQGRVLFISHAVTRLGYGEDELVGRSIFDLVDPDDLERCRRRLDERRTGRRRTTGLEIRFRRKPGEVGADEVHDPVFRLEAEGLYEAHKDGLLFKGTIGIARDISRRKAVEKRLQHSLKEKQLLLREIQHRVKNNLQVLSSLLELNASKVSSEEAVGICREIQGHIRCVALIHTMLSMPGTGDTVNMNEFIRELFVSVAALYPQSRIVPVFTLDDVYLHLDKALPCGMLLNELFANGHKHAFPEGGVGEMRVGLTQLEDGRVRLLVADNGVGLSPSREGESGRTMGMRLVTNLAAQLHGNLDISGNDGMAVHVEFSGAPPRDRLTPEV